LFIDLPEVSERIGLEISPAIEKWTAGTLKDEALLLDDKRTRSDKRQDRWLLLF